MATLNLADGESFVKGRNGATARKLLEAAGERGAEVRTTSYGYILPTDLVPEGVEAITNADTPAVTTEPGTPKNVEDVFNKGGVRNAPVGTPLPEADDEPHALVRSVPDGAARVVLPGSAAAAGEQTGEATGEATGDPAGESSGEAQGEAQGTSEEETDNGDNVAAFDPSTATVDQVNEYLAGADDAERQRVLAAEVDGKNRKGIVDANTTPEEGK